MVLGRLRSNIVGVVLLAAFAGSSISSAQSIPISASKPMRLPPGTSIGPAELLLRLPASAVAALVDLPTLQDTTPPVNVTPPTPPAQPVQTEVSFTSAERLYSGNPDEVLLRVQATVKGLPANATVSRTATLTWGKFVQPFAYFLSNVAAPALTWRVTGVPPEWALSERRCFQVRLSPTGTRATGIGVTSTLVEASTRTMLSGLYLSVDGKTPATASSLEHAVNDLGTLVSLCFPDAVTPGKYQGVITINAAESDAGSVNAVVLSSDFWYRAAGGAILFIGCLLALWVRALLPARLNRNLAWLSVTVLREKTERLLDRLGQTVAPKTRARLDAVNDQLSDTEMADLIPPGMPPINGSDTAALQKRVNDASTELDKLYIVLVEGIAQVQGDATKTTAIDALDPALSGQELRTKINGIVLPALAPGVAAAAGQSSSSRHLRIRIDKAHSQMWFAWVVLTFLAGLIVLVLNNPGFGVPTDFFYCLVWGVGVPLAGQPLTSGSATTALGVVFPSAGQKT